MKTPIRTGLEPKTRMTTTNAAIAKTSVAIARRSRRSSGDEPSAIARFQRNSATAPKAIRRHSSNAIAHPITAPSLNGHVVI